MNYAMFSHRSVREALMNGNRIILISEASKYKDFSATYKEDHWF